MKKATPQQQLMLAFRNTEEQYVVTITLASLNDELQEEVATDLVAYIRFGIKRDDIQNPFAQGVFDNLVSYLDFTRGDTDKIPTNEFPSPVLYTMAEWSETNPDRTVMFNDNSKHVHTYADLIECFPHLKEPIREHGHKPEDPFEYDDDEEDDNE